MIDKREVRKPRAGAASASVEHGIALLGGPDYVAVGMTAKTALKTAECLLAAANEAIAGRYGETS